MSSTSEDAKATPSAAELALTGLGAAGGARRPQVARYRGRTQIASLRETMLNLTHENQLLKRRIYGNKTERTQTSEFQLALGDLLDDEKRAAKTAQRGRGRCTQRQRRWIANGRAEVQAVAQGPAGSVGKQSAAVPARDLRRAARADRQTDRLRGKPPAHVPPRRLLGAGQAHRQVRSARQGRDDRARRGSAEDALPARVAASFGRRPPVGTEVRARSAALSPRAASRRSGP